MEWMGGPPWAGAVCPAWPAVCQLDTLDRRRGAAVKPGVRESAFGYLPAPLLPGICPNRTER